ncbi:MAG TPA: VWA domain-containing protein [Blastocatellia bacterium]|nr:VWA domain-containing protein [Blastocatellia bacterium]
MKLLPRTEQYRTTTICFCLGWAVMVFVLVLGTDVWAQAGRNVATARRTTVLPLFVRFTEDTTKPKPLLGTKKTEETEKILTRDKIELYDNGINQKVESLAPDPSPARIVVLMDNSATLQTDVKKMAAVPAAFAPEIYEGDKVMVIGYDLKPEIITDFTDKPEDLQNTQELLRKTDTPHLFDALDVVMEDVLRPQVGYSKRVIVLVSDGLDRDSKVKFDRILSTLQDENITVYAIQVKDRTRGALRKDAPKPVDCLEQLTVGTGGKIYSIESDIKQAIKEICDELRNERYQLTYYPEGINPINKRHLLLTSHDASVVLRFKGFHPPHRY